MCQIKNNRGFTLLEIVMATAVLGIFLSIVYGFLSFSFRDLNQKGNEHESYIQARSAMIRLTYELQKYQNLSVDESSNKIQSGTKTIVSSLLIDNPDYYYVAAGSTGKLLNKAGNVVVDNISFSVRPYGDDLIQITIEAYPEENSSDSSLKLSTLLFTSRNVQ